jgi:DNA topoisomerase-3
VVKENYRRFACTACDWSITKSPSSRLLEPAEAEQLIRERTIGPLHGFRSKMGRPFSAILKLVEPDWKLEFDFGQSDGSDDDEPVDFSDQSSVGACPRCQSRVFEHGMSYVCEKSVGPGRTCDFRSGKVILQQPVEREQMSKLLAGGRTDLLDGFVSSRTRRRFKAYLVRQPDGKVGFEFQAAAPKVGAKPAAAAALDGADDDGDTAVATRPTTTARGAVRPAAPARPAARAAAPSSSKTTTVTAVASPAKTPAKAPAKSSVKAPAKKAAATKTAKATKKPATKTPAKAPTKAALRPAAKPATKAAVTATSASARTATARTRKAG